jgi:cytochrome c1
VPRLIVFGGIAALFLLVLGGAARSAGDSPKDGPIEGNAKQGAEDIINIGCGACHVIPGISGAAGLVGPPLTQVGRRVFLAGLLRNTPDNMVAWLLDPQKILPGNAMPNMGLSEEQAQDIAAYLYTLR